MKQNNSLQAIQVIFNCYATPINTSGGISGRYGDHTFVYATSAGGATYNCTCYGGIIVPTPLDVPIVTIPGGDMRSVGCMINLNPVLQPNYNGWLDNCGIIYGLQGVCHQMTNRILMEAGLQVMPLGTVHGYILSFLLYGFFGDTPSNYLTRVLLAQGIAALSGLGSEQVDNVEGADPVFDSLRFTEFSKKMEESISSLDDNMVKLLLQMEVYGVSCLESRLSVLYQYFILAGDSSKIQTDTKFKELLQELSEFLKRKKTIFEDKMDEYGKIKKLNEAFFHMNQSMVDILGGVNYNKLFQCSFNKEFYLYEYPDISLT